MSIRSSRPWSLRSALFDSLGLLRDILATPHRRASSPLRTGRFRPAILLLEDRLAPATLTVTSNADTGAGSLRAAITAASAGDTIRFNQTLTGGSNTITLASTLVISKNLTITDAAFANVTVSGNNAVEVFSIASGTVVMDSLTITKGSARVGGGIANGGTLTVQNSTITGNAGTNSLGGGAGIYNTGSLTVLNSTFSNNTLGYGSVGAAIGNSGVNSILMIENCTFTGNVAGGPIDIIIMPSFGGAIANVSGTVTVQDSILTGNVASTLGGGIYSSLGTLTVQNSTLSGNSAGNLGGAIRTIRNTTSLTNSTIYGNTAPTGGGVELTYGNATLTNTTITHNRATNTGNNGGGLLVSGATVTLVNTIVAGNFQGASPGTTASDISGNPVNTAASFNNLIGTGGSGGLTNGTQGNQVNVTNPGLGTLASNGGPTQTVALLAGSPALDAGTNTGAPTIDQRGAERGPTGLNAGSTVDIGAFEASSSYLVSNTSDNLSTVGSLRTAIGWANINTNVNPANSPVAPNTIRFDSAGLFATAQTITLGGSGLAIKNSVTVAGPGQTLLTINGNNQSRIFNVNDNNNAVTQNVIISGVTISGGGHAVNGGGITSSENLTLQNSTVSGNTATANGGGLYQTAYGSLSLIDSTLSGNSAANGGGLYNEAPVTVQRSTFSANTATAYGGALFVTRTTSLVNSTIAGNTANKGGGVAIFANLPGDTVSFTNVTITGNRAVAGGGGGIFHSADAATVSLVNSIVAGNFKGASPSSTPDDIASGALIPVLNINNLIGTGGSGGLIDGMDGNLVGVANPGLGTLANNGGTTQTIALLGGSPAINAGSSTGAPATDQRGLARPQNGAFDIGAFEVGAPDPTRSLVTVSASSIAVNNSSKITLQAVDQFGILIPVGGAQITFSLGAGTSNGTLSGVTDNGDGTYTALFIGSAIGTARTIKAKVGSVAVTTTLPTITVATALLDVDGNGTADALTDGILILRYLFHFTGSTLTSGALGTAALRTNPTVITTYLDGIKTTVLDVDGNNTVDALTDGILILRYLFSFTGTTLTSGALGSSATRTTGAAVKAFLDPFNPNLGPLVVTIYTSLNSPTTAPGTIPVTFVFNRSVTAFTSGDIQVTNGSPGSLVVVQAGSIYTLNVTPTTLPSGQETVTVTVPAGVVHDLAGNGNLVSTLTVTVVFP